MILHAYKLEVYKSSKSWSFLTSPNQEQDTIVQKCFEKPKNLVFTIVSFTLDQTTKSKLLEELRFPFSKITITMTDFFNFRTPRVTLSFQTIFLIYFLSSTKSPQQFHQDGFLNQLTKPSHKDQTLKLNVKPMDHHSHQFTGKWLLVSRKNWFLTSKFEICNLKIHFETI